MIHRMRRSIEPGLGLALLFALPALIPLLESGIGDMADATLHIDRAVELVSLWREGVVFSRWAPNLVFGLGYPLFNFYAPLFYYLTGFVHLFGFDFEMATKIVLALILLAGCWGMYGLARQWVGQLAALLAAVAFTYSPFRLREIHFQGDFAQFLGLALMPIILWGVHRLAVTGQGRYFAWVVFSWAALILSHSISMMLFSPLLFAYAAFLLWTQQGARANLLPLLAALALGLGVSAFFWFPAIYEKQFVWLDALRGGDFDFRIHYPPSLDLISPSIPLDVSAVDPVQPFNLGLAHLIVMLPSLFLLRRNPLRGIVVLCWAGLAVMVFMMAPISIPLWEIVPLLDFTEFPWRWLGVAAVPLAFLCGASAEVFSRWRPVYVLIACLAIIISVFPQLYARQPTTRFDRVTSIDVLRHELATQAIGTTSAGEYLPRVVAEKPRTSPLVENYLAGQPIDKLDRSVLPPGASATLQEHGPLRDRWQFTTAAPFVARILTFNFLGWQAYLDGRPVALEPAGPDGMIQVTIPAGRHELLLRFEDTLERKLVHLVSVASLALVAALLISRRLGWRRISRLWPREHTVPAGHGSSMDGASTSDSLPRGVAAVFVTAAVALIVGKVAFVDPRTTWFRLESSLDAVPGLEQPLRADFGAQMRLLGYTLDRRTAQPGDPVTLTLFWQALQPLDKDYSTFVHMLDASGIVAQKDSAHPNGVPTSSWRLNKYARDDHVIEVPAQLPPGRYGLRVGAYDAATGVRLPLDGTDTDELWLPDMVRVGGMPSRQSARVEYKLGDAIELVAFEVAETQVGMDQPIDLRLYWRVHAPLLSDYSVFVHLYDETGNLVSVADARPLQGAYPTNQWQVGETIEDRRQIALPAGAEPGNYQLAVGLYDPVSLNRLPVQDQNGQRAPEDAIRLQVVTFGSP